MLPPPSSSDLLEAPRVAAGDLAPSPGCQQPALAYVRSGQTSFFRLPVAETSRPGAAAYRGAGAVVLGVPWDGGTTYRPGARLAPYHVRRTSALVQAFHRAHGIDVLAETRAIDGGNVAFPPFDPAAVRETICAEVRHVLAAAAVPLLVGGDHSIALPALRAVAERHGPLAVVHVDAHLDTSDGSAWGETHHHGTPLRHALAEGLVAPGQLFQVAIRAGCADAAEASFSQRHGAIVFAMDDIARHGIAAVAGEVRRRVGTRKAYLTFDIDAVDPAFAPGTGTPVPGGLSSSEAIQLLRGLAGIDLAGMDLVEVAPPFDHADLTGHLAAQLLYEGLALAALRGGEPGSFTPV